ncbi:uncharacterized protein LOC134515692 isoform X2 [Chroicocephalus ridibundus]|uniref:uncharacterized protein LOC134515692 isoform X2 n=1 Tax=Chroicocephalus ridibundus TaxID=1192867 RepID=UPI002FDC94D5
MRNKPPFPPCPPRFIFHFSLCQAPACSLRTSPGGVRLVQGSRDRDGRAVPCRLAQPGSHSGCLSGSYQQERPCLSGKRAPWAQCASGSCVERLASDRHGGIICNAPRLSCALSQRPVPDLRKSCKVGAGVAVPVERDLEFPAQSRQCSASALKRSPEYLEMQDSVLLCLASVVLHLRRWKDSLQVPPETSPGLSLQFLLSVPMELDAQEQRIYQLQTKQRERQAELEQKCSRIPQLSQDVEASHQLQEEAQSRPCTQHHSSLAG